MMRKTASQIAAVVLTKLSEQYDVYGNLVPESPPYVPMALGGTLGGIAAHLFPTAKAEDFRALAEKVPLNVDTVSGGFRDATKATRFEAPPEIMKKFYENQALRANALRMIGGIGAGALTGYALNRLLGDE